MREVMNTQNAQMANEMVLAEDEPFDLDSGNLFKPFSRKAMKLGSVSSDQPHRKQEIQKFPNKMVLNKKNTNSVGSVQIKLNEANIWWWLLVAISTELVPL